MSYSLIEAYGHDESILLDGRSYKTPSLVEDADGLRWFLTDSFFHVRGAHWARAVAGGAAALLAPLGTGWAAITTERFMEERREANGSYSLAQGWAESTSLPTYRDLLDAKATVVVADEDQPGFVHLHTHTEYSPMDGRTRVTELMTEVVRHGQTAVAATDHGGCSVHPMLQKEADKAGVKAIFGIEAYLVHDRFRRPIEWWETTEGVQVTDDEMSSMTVGQRNKTLVRQTDAKEVRSQYFHLTLLAQNQTGLRNIWAMSTEGFRDGFYYNPRMDWDTLARHSEGVICLSGCLRGPVAVPITQGDEMEARQHLGLLMEIFEERLYLEIMPNDLPEQIKVNEALVAFSRDYGLPLVATVDSHYPTDEALPQHKAWVSAQTNTDIQDETDLFAHDLGLFVKSEEQVRKGFPYLAQADVDQAIWNTGRIAESCTARIPIKVTMPVFSKKGGAERDEERLLDMCLANWHMTEGKEHTQDEYMARFEHEFPMLVRKGFCGYFLQVAEYCAWAKSEGIMVGPGRGSGGGSLVAYLAQITAIDPVDGELLFERFMTEGREAMPDFDVDFPSSRRGDVQDHITDRYGAERVVRVGTHTRVKNKGVIKDMFRAMKSTLPETSWMDAEKVSKIITEAESVTAGLGLSWDDLWASDGDLLQPYADKYPEVFEMAGHLVGILKSYGKHPAGLVVSTDESLVDSLPLRSSDEAQMITQFDMAALELMGYIKFDILTLRTLDTIQETVDLIKKNRGHQVDVYAWKDEYLDPQVWAEISDGHTLGVFQVETASGVGMCKKMRPSNLNEFADTLTLVRPGPRNSGLTDLYLARRAGESEVTFPDPRLETVLSKTYGCLVYQEDIMQTTMVLAGYDSNKADEVRKILGKKKVELVVSAGQEFVEGCVTNGMDRQKAVDLWEQMAEFAKYSFNRAHAYGYAVLAYWTAWLKVHYPVEFFTSVLSTVKADRIPDFVNEARRMGLSILPPDVNESGPTFTCQGLSVRYGLGAISGLGEASLAPILAGQPYSSFEDFRERSGADSGKVATLAKIGGFDAMVPNRRGLETLLLREKTGDATKCVNKDESVSGPGGLPCTFDWDSEEAPVNPRTGKTLKKKDPPKKCTRACRQYVAPPPFDISTVEEYTEADVRNIEMEVLGLHLSSTAFDQIPEADREALYEQAEMIEHGPHGSYLLAVTVARMRKHIDKSRNEMAFLGLVTECGEIDVICFSKTWEKYKDNLSVGDLRIVEVQKNERGVNLMFVAPVL